MELKLTCGVSLLSGHLPFNRTSMELKRDASKGNCNLSGLLKGYESFQNVFVDISRFIPVALAYTGIIIGGIDIIMLLSDWYANRKQQQIEAAKQSGKAEGKAEGRQELLEELKASGVDVSKVESKPKE